MCVHTLAESSKNKNNNKGRIFVFYILAVIMAVFTAFTDIAWLQSLANVIADAFVNMFKCISLPLIAVSMIVTLNQYNTERSMARVWRRTILYTLTTTIIAASVACVLYVLIKPASITVVGSSGETVANIANSTSYFTFITKLIPANFLLPFLEQQVISVLLLGLLVGVAARKIKNKDAQNTLNNLFKAVHEVLLVITGWVVKIVPLALYGFMTVMIMQLKNGVAISGLWSYLSIIVLANLLQGLVILPLWLLFNGIRPFFTMRGMLPALSLAFFTKSSAGTLPVTIETAEKNIAVDSRVSRLVLPLCTMINMNGCAAFIFVTVVYLLQNQGIVVTPSTMSLWILISTVAAVGNAGVPMGCFFLSASLLASMNVPITILGLILPLYSLIDMLETALNVWSDTCIAKVIDHKEKNYSAVVSEVMG